MRVGPDTRVLGIPPRKQNPPPAAVVHAVEQDETLLKSRATERQLFAVVARPYFVPLIGRETRAWLRKLMVGARLVRITERIAACRDPTDDKFLELAANGRANLIVSGDTDL